MNKIIGLVLSFLATAAFAVAGTQYLGSDTSLYYGPSRLVVMGGGQTITTEDGTGYVLSGRLASYKDHFIDYGPSRTVIILGNSLVEFSGGYLSKGVLYTSASSQWLYYGSSNESLFLANSVATFAGGYVTSGYLYSGSFSVPYGSGSVYVNNLALTEFEPGSTGVGVVKKCVLSSAQGLNYGPSSRWTYIRANGTFTSFSGGYVSHGVLEYGDFLQTSSGSVYRAASTICDFAGGYYTP